MDSRYSPLDHGGLEAVERNDGLEVVDQNDRLDEKRQNHGNYYWSMSESDTSQEQTPQSDFAKPAYFHTDAAVDSHLMHVKKSERRYCGLRKRLFIILLSALILLLCIGAILGGVLSTVLPRENARSSAQALSDGEANNSSNTLQTDPQTGLASTMLADDSGRLLIYYQAPDGRIIENSYLDEKFTLDDHAMVDGSVVTSDADQGSPLAAVSYQKDRQTVRRLFFMSKYGAVMTTYSTTTSNNVATSWSEPEPISDEPMIAGSLQLAACTGSGYQGIRVYYPTNTYISEVIYHFSNDSFTEGGTIDQGDSFSGVACNVYNAPPDYQIINVYFRNKATFRLQQSYVAFDSTTFSDGPKAPLNQTIAERSDIAVCSDETATEFLFYQAADGTVMRSSLPPESNYFGEFTAVGAARALDSKLAAAYLQGTASNSGAALTSQSSTSNTTMRLSQWSRSGASLLDTDVT